MKPNTLARIFAFCGTAMCLGTLPGFAAELPCQNVGGGILTNFIDQTSTDGTATGDLRGAVGVAILEVNGNIYHVHHHWVTESGDTIFAKDAFLTTYPTPDPNRVLADYLNGVEIIGGTGRFDGATGKVFAFGAVDLSLGQITLRYSGKVCFHSDR